MRIKEQRRIGLLIFLLNIILILFLNTGGEALDIYLIISVFSSLVATLINYYYLKQYKNIPNLFFLILNIVVTNAIVLYIYIK